MKKVLMFLLLFLLIGCSNGDLNNNDDNNINAQRTEQEIKEDNYVELSNKIIQYMSDFYTDNSLFNTSVVGDVYVVTLKDFSDYGYDISMFKNPLTGNKCDLSYTYGELRIVNNVDELTPNYIINTNLTCEE